MARRNPMWSFSGQVTAVIRQRGVPKPDRPTSARMWEPAVNVYELDDRVQICVELAGVSRERLQVRVEPGRLWVEGIRQPPDPAPSSEQPVRTVHMEIDDGPFSREIPLPMNVLLDKVQSTYHDGMLCITLPTRPTRGRGRRS
ncbi:Hsp20/alpha crystallin family protein [Phycisphaerales bacterium AB-hyl4]|uniref:Hsp20/alpha crystallin family protein n=1 Tax=Natronomicrosphaera hydrolytica TaxID=3242702 RepID=A0ABV4U7S7_9BACT